MSDLIPVRTRASADDNLIPLINIVFLLLIFFMIAGQINQMAPDDIEAPLSVSEAPMESTNIVVTMTREGVLAVNGEPSTLENLQSVAGQWASDNSTISFKADRQLRASDVDPVLSALKSAGVAKVTLFSQAGEASP